MIVLVPRIRANLCLEFPAPILQHEHFRIRLLLGLLVVAQPLLHLLVLLPYLAGLIDQLADLCRVVLVTAHLVERSCLLVLDLVQRVGLGLELVQLSLRVLQLRLELVELVEADAVQLGVQVLVLGLF